MQDIYAQIVSADQMTVGGPRLFASASCQLHAHTQCYLQRCQGLLTRCEALKRLSLCPAPMTRRSRCAACWCRNMLGRQWLVLELQLDTIPGKPAFPLTRMAPQPSSDIHGLIDMQLASIQVEPLPNRPIVQVLHSASVTVFKLGVSMACHSAMHSL